MDLTDHFQWYFDLYLQENKWFEKYNFQLPSLVADGALATSVTWIRKQFKK